MTADGKVADTTPHRTRHATNTHVTCVYGVGTGQAPGREKEKKELGRQQPSQPPDATPARILLASRAENAMGNCRTVGCALKEPTTESQLPLVCRST